MRRPPGTPEIHLRQIGYWRNASNDLPDPKKLVDADWRRVDRDRIVSYLKSGVLQSQEYGYSFCRFACGIPNRDMGTRNLTDGIWIWPEGLWHYIEAHDVRLPDEVIAVMEENGFRMPETHPRDVIQWASTDMNWWKEWASGPGP